LGGEGGLADKQREAQYKTGQFFHVESKFGAAKVGKGLQSF
jgi:hypothetical protein